MPVTIEGTLKEATFVKRSNPSLVHARVGSKTVQAHLPEPGRLDALMVPGTPFLLRKHKAASREAASRWSVVAARHAGAWVLLDPRLTNDVVAHGLERGALRTVFPDILSYKRDARGRHGRFDFMVDTRRGPVWVETRSVWLQAPDGTTGLYPDAPQEEAKRRLDQLVDLTRLGERTAVLFVALRDDLRAVQANRAADPAFADAMERAYKAGVHIAAWGTRIDGGATVTLTGELPIAWA